MGMRGEYRKTDDFMHRSQSSLQNLRGMATRGSGLLGAEKWATKLKFKKLTLYSPPQKKIKLLDHIKGDSVRAFVS